MSIQGAAAISADPLATARALAERFAVGSAERDRDRRFPREELDELKASGLLGLRLPRALGGTEVDTATIVNLTGELAVGDPNIAQMFLIHAYGEELITALPESPVKERLAARVLGGEFVTNAFNEVGTKTIMEFRTTVGRNDDGEFRLNGKKFYATGSLAGDFMYVVAVTDDPEPQLRICWADTDAPGVVIHDDWLGLGQRTTASGTIELTDVPIEADDITMVDHLMTPESLFGNFGQVSFSAIFIGMAKGALRDGFEFVRTRARPRPESGVETATEDPYVLMRAGELEAKLAAAEGALVLALDARAEAEKAGTAAARDAASIAAGHAKVVAGDAALDISSGIFRICGASATLEKYGLDRHWRNARTLTLHDRWITSCGSPATMRSPARHRRSRHTPSVRETRGPPERRRSDPRARNTCRRLRERGASARPAPDWRTRRAEPGSAARPVRPTNASPVPVDDLKLVHKQWRHALELVVYEAKPPVSTMASPAPSSHTRAYSRRTSPQARQSLPVSWPTPAGSAAGASGSSLARTRRRANSQRPSSRSSWSL